MSTYQMDAAKALARWGASTEMNPLEAVMWRADAEPRLRSTILTIEILDSVPDWDRLVEAMEWGVKAVPRTRQRVVEPPLRLGAPTWVDDDRFDLHYHLRHMALAGDGSMRDLLDTTRTLAMTPFDRSRPPWELTLIEGLGDGQAAFVSKMHHSMTDGLGAMQFLSLARSRSREHTFDKAVLAEQAPHPRPSAMQMLGEQVLRTVRHTPAIVRRGAGEAASLASRLLRNPVKPVEDAIHYVESLRRVLGHTPAPGSPLLAKRSASWHLETHDVPLADLKAAARAADASLNDAYIAGLLGAFRRYHEHFGVDIEEMPIAFPISLRRGEDPLGGNRFAGVRLAGPVGEADPAERIRGVHAAVEGVLAEPAVASLDKLLGALSRAPTPQIVQVMLQIGEDNDLQASNIPGLPFEVYLAGAKVLRMYPIGPLPGCAAMVTMLSHNGICCIGANLDPAAVTAPDLFAKYMAESFEEVLEVGR